MAQAERKSGGKLLLLLDQFEEFLILGTAEQKRSLVGQITGLQSAAQAGRILLVLRSDYQILLDELDMPRLYQDENTFHLGRFTMSAASDFMGRSGLDLHPETLAQLLRSIAELDETPGLVRPIILNIVGYVLAVGRLAEPRNASQIIRQYIEQTIGDPVIRDFAPKVLEQLVTEQGTKLPRSELLLVDATQLRRGEVRAVMNGLGAAALARPLDPLNSVWELSHDFVARAIMRSSARQRRRLLKRSAQFAVPALFVAALSAILIIGAWHRLSPYQTRSELAELGIVVTTSDKELKADLSQHFKAAALPAIVLLLSGLNEPLALDLSSPDVEDIAPLENVPTLRRLSLADTHVTSLEPLRHLSDLQELDLSGARVRDIAPLEQLTNLRALYLSGLEIQDFHPLERLVSLEDLDLSATPFSDVQPLTKLRNLRALNLRANELSNITRISELTSLRKLDLSLTNIADLRPLQSLPDLEELALGTGSLERVRSTSSFLSPLGSAPSSLTNFLPLSGIQNLRKLSLSGTNIMNLEPLIGLRKLTDLNLESTKIDSIDALGEMTSLQRLNIRETNIKDLQSIQRLTNLEELVIDSSAGEGIEQKLNLPKLHVVRVFSGPI
jgi:Leucine-rich repeat (LRR) protein